MIRRNSIFLEAASPEVSPYGILSPATTVVYEDSEDWIAGFEYETSDSSAEVVNGTIYGADTPVNEVVISANPSNPTYRFYYPFDIKASIKASTHGNTPEKIQQDAEKKLDIVTQKALEIEFWNGDLAKQLSDPEHVGNRYLSHVDATDVTPTAGTAVKVRYGQALLEQALGNATIGSKGVIHAPLLLASVLQTSDIDGALTTNLGTKVVAGPGYSNTGPNGQVAPTGAAWMYATGPVTVRLGRTSIAIPEKPNQSVNVKTNTIEYFIDRPAAVTWSTTNLYAVLVDLTLDYA